MRRNNAILSLNSCKSFKLFIKFMLHWIETTFNHIELKSFVVENYNINLACMQIEKPIHSVR